MVGFVIYFRQVESEDFNSPAHLNEFIHTWLDMHTAPPLREEIEGFIAEGFLQPQIARRDQMPELPEDSLRAYNPGEIEECRFRDATHIALVGTQDVILAPRVGYWAAVAVARALATHFVGGVILDLEFPRLLPREKHLEDLPPQGTIHVTEHILVTVGPDGQRGHCTMFTRGMMRFGLPDLEMQDVPANLVKSMLLVVNGVAQYLVEQSTQAAEACEAQGGEDLDELRHLEIAEEILLTRENVRLSYKKRGEEPQEALRQEEEQHEQSETSAAEGGVVPLRLALHLAPDSPPLLHILPPRSVTTSLPIWYNQLLSDLFGAASMRDIPTLVRTAQTNDPTVLQAQQESLKTLTQVKRRFQNGFRSGEVLYIKHGFLLTSGNHEYMWINVTHWDESGEIRGQLANDPRSRLDLRVGQEVSLLESDVFDWLITYLDGRTEGGHTTNALHETFDDEP
jgi:uncharacterized protein YegJ (DUF2314 family)